MFTCSTCICKNLGTFLEIHVGAPVFSILGISFEQSRHDISHMSVHFLNKPLLITNYVSTLQSKFMKNNLIMKMCNGFWQVPIKTFMIQCKCVGYPNKSDNLLAGLTFAWRRIINTRRLRLVLYGLRPNHISFPSYRELQMFYSGSFVKHNI